MQRSAYHNFTVQIVKTGIFLQAEPQNPTRRAQKSKNRPRQKQKNNSSKGIAVFSCVFYASSLPFARILPRFYQFFHSFHVYIASSSKICAFLFMFDTCKQNISRYIFPFRESLSRSIAFLRFHVFSLHHVVGSPITCLRRFF